jgi:hypothetical protein
VKRRELLGGVAGAGALALGGCLGSAREVYPWPTVDEETLAGWDRLYERSDEYGVSYWGIEALSVHERRYSYEYTELRDSVAGLTGNEIDRSLARFVASRMTLEGIGRPFATPERLVDDAMEGIESELREEGLESIERVETTDPLPAVDGEIVEYRGEIGIPSFSREVDAYGVSTTIPSTRRGCSRSGCPKTTPPTSPAGSTPPRTPSGGSSPPPRDSTSGPSSDSRPTPRSFVSGSSRTWRRRDEGPTDF